ncbi:hypothetical protein RJ641_012722 [Dillenia turbinata]|uniref:Uncharacterized protein n=1 Tax=Dillenia turbinata TaxID=194707 RepID=A0AAN8Z4C5_9MAGN
MTALKCRNLVGTCWLMCPTRTSNFSRALDGLHGVHLVPHSPFQSEEGDFHQSTCKSLADKRILVVQRVWQQRPDCLRPIRCSLCGDLNFTETIANVLTSLPFIALGIQAPRSDLLQLDIYTIDHLDPISVHNASIYRKKKCRKNLNCKLYANSLIGVGVASSLYHSSRGKVRQYLRWFDYTMIATATVCLSGALRNENPKFLMAASALLLPIQPLMVSAVHTGMMEVAFAKRALKDPDLRMAHTVHKMSSLLGGAFFIADDFFPETPYLHAAWHLAAAFGVGTCNKLLE